MRKLKPGRLITLDNQKVRLKAVTDDLEVLGVRYYSHAEDGHIAFVEFADDQALVVHDLDGDEKAFFMELIGGDELEPGGNEFPRKIWIESGSRDQCYRQGSNGPMYGFIDELDDDGPECCFCTYASKTKQAIACLTDVDAFLWAGFRIPKGCVIF